MTTPISVGTLALLACLRCLLGCLFSRLQSFGCGLFRSLCFLDSTIICKKPFYWKLVKGCRPIVHLQWVLVYAHQGPIHLAPSTCSSIPYTRDLRSRRCSWPKRGSISHGYWRDRRGTLQEAFRDPSFPGSKLGSYRRPGGWH